MAKGKRPVGRPKKVKLPPLDLSKYNSVERLPGNVVSILKNALIMCKADAEGVAHIYNISVEKVNEVLLENYLQIAQIINTSMKSNEVDDGINSIITNLKNHVAELKRQSKGNALLKDSTVKQLNSIADRFLNAKSQYTNAYDKLINNMMVMDQKERQVQVLENGKVEDSSEYLENQNTVENLMKDYLATKAEKNVTLINVKTYEVKKFTGDRARSDAEQFLGVNGHLSDICRQKSPYRGEWIVCYDGKKNIANNREY